MVPSRPRAGLAHPDWVVASLKCCRVSQEGSGQAELVEPLGEGEGRGGSAEACIFGLVFAGSLSHPQVRAHSKQAEETKAKAGWRGLGCGSRCEHGECGRSLPAAGAIAQGRAFDCRSRGP